MAFVQSAPRHWRPALSGPSFISGREPDASPDIERRMTQTPAQTLPSWQGLGFMHTRQAKWLVVCAAFLPLFFQIQLRGQGILIMLLVAGAYAVTLSQAEMMRILRASPILAYPALAVVSTLWSEAPAITFRLSLQFFITAGLGVLFYRTMPFRTLMSGLFTAALIACIAAPIFDPYFLLYRHALSGIAGSKNMMAFYASLLCLVALAIALDRGAKPGLRVAALAGALYGTVILFFAQSTGAYVGTAAGAVVIIAGRFFLTASGSVRTLAVVAVLLMLPVGIISQQVVANEATEFSQDVLGKDTTTLTGRTYLWQRAGEYIAEKPILGHGYSAFWRKGSVEAEGLWRMYGVKTQIGFNFHNQFIEALMDVGYVGMLLFVVMLVVTTVALGVRLLNHRSPELPFLAGMFVCLIMRLPVESVTLAVFNMITIMLFMVSTAAIYGQGSGALRLATASIRGQRRVRQVQEDRGLVQRRATKKAKRVKALRQVKTQIGTSGRRMTRGRRVLRQTRATSLRQQRIRPEPPKET